tara:strand:- start:71 stop:409 length:339 start_codon:yes stop_codon:yes gene_type:complete
MDLDKQQGVKHVKREDLGDFGAENINGFLNYIAQEIGDDKDSILPQVMQKNTESIALHNMSKAHRDNLDVVTGAPTKGYNNTNFDDYDDTQEPKIQEQKPNQFFSDHYTPKR